MEHMEYRAYYTLLKDEFEFFFEKVITKFGNGAKIDAPKELLGKKVYVIVRK